MAEEEARTDSEAAVSKRAVFRGGGSPSLRCGVRSVRALPYFGRIKLISGRTDRTIASPDVGQSRRITGAVLSAYTGAYYSRFQGTISAEQAAL